MVAGFNILFTGELMLTIYIIYLFY